MELDVKTLSGSDSGKVPVGFDLVDAQKGNQAVHDTVVAFMAAQRMGTAKTKTRGEVSGTGKKPWRQKGTGRARTGSREPHLYRWRCGSWSQAARLLEKGEHQDPPLACARR